MDENNGNTQDQPCFRAVLSPYRSLHPAGFVILMGLLAVVSFAAGIVFLVQGAWPVAGFFGLDLVIVYIAFKLNYRAGRIYETVELTPDLLIVRRCHPSGREQNFEFNPYWVRVRLHESRGGRSDLALELQGRVLSFGKFLTDDERRDFAGALKAALIEARGGVRI